MAFFKRGNAISSFRQVQRFNSPFTLSKPWQPSSRRDFSIVSSYGGHTTAGKAALIGLTGICTGLYFLHNALAIDSGNTARAGLQSSDIKIVSTLTSWLPVTSGKGPILYPQPEARRRLVLLRERFMASRAQLDMGHYYTAFTSSFMHVNWWHIGINLLGARSLVTPFAQSVGFPVFALVWTGAAVTGTVTQLYGRDLSYRIQNLLSPSTNVVANKQVAVTPQLDPDRKAIGASAALCGLLGSLTWMFPWAFGRSTLVLVGVSALCEVTGSAGNIGHLSHMGGLGFGMLFGALFLKRVPRYAVQGFH